MITALNRPKIRDFCVLVIGRSECRNETGVSLKPSIQPIAIPDVKQWCRSEIICGFTDRNRRSSAHDNVVAMIVDIL
jgi:hypothetical protein